VNSRQETRLGRGRILWNDLSNAKEARDLKWEMSGIYWSGSLKNVRRELAKYVIFSGGGGTGQIE
jgi:hypothetical protein